MRKSAYILLLTTIVFVLSCSKTSNDDTDQNIDRAAILDNLGNIIVQNYTQLKTDADSLNIYADSFQTNTTEQTSVANNTNLFLLYLNWIIFLM